MQTKKISELIEEHGLVCCSFAYNDLPNSVKQQLLEAYPGNFENTFFTLLANAGSTFWDAMALSDRTDLFSSENPVDEFSISIATKLITMGEQTQNAEILYPGFQVPLITLGELSGWSSPSPLGLGLHPVYGPWFAYRALIKSDSPLQPTQTLSNVSRNDSLKRYSLSTDSAVRNFPISESPCISCVDTPCISACPASATSINNVFDIKRCASHRLQKDSGCKTQCHARNACPVGQAYQYSEKQREYHMTRALNALQKWAAQSDE